MSEPVEPTSPEPAGASVPTAPVEPAPVEPTPVEPTPVEPTPAVVTAREERKEVRTQNREDRRAARDEAQAKKEAEHAIKAGERRDRLRGQRQRAHNDRHDGLMDQLADHLTNAISRAGGVTKWLGVAVKLIPIIAWVVSQIQRATDPDSPGGAKLTSREAMAIAREGADRFGAKLIEVISEHVTHQDDDGT